MSTQPNVFEQSISAIVDERCAAASAGDNAILQTYSHAVAMAQEAGWTDADLSKDGVVYARMKADFEARAASGSYVSEMAKVMKPSVRAGFDSMIATAGNMAASARAEEQAHKGSTQQQDRNVQKVFLKLATATVEAGGWSEAIQTTVLNDRATKRAQAALPTAQFDKAKKGVLRALKTLAAIPNLSPESSEQVRDMQTLISGMTYTPSAQAEPVPAPAPAAPVVTPAAAPVEAAPVVTPAAAPVEAAPVVTPAAAPVEAAPDPAAAIAAALDQLDSNALVAALTNALTAR